MIKYVWETNIFNFSRKDVLICHLVVTNPSKNTLHTHSVLNYFNFTFLYIVESIFSSVWEMKREQFCHQTIFFHFARKWISFHDKEHLLLHWASFHTRKYSCYHDRGILILTTISIVVPNHFDHSFQSSLLCIITTWIFALQHISYKLLRAQFQRPLHRRNWAPPNIIAIIPCANVAEISNNLIFLFMNLKSRTSPSWYFDVNLNSNEVTNFHVSWERDGTVRHALEWRKSIYKS